MASRKPNAIQGKDFTNIVHDVVNIANLATNKIGRDGDEITMGRKQPMKDWLNEASNVSHRIDVEYINIERASPSSNKNPQRNPLL